MGESPDQQIDCQPNDACIGCIAAKLYTVFNDKEKLLIHKILGSVVPIVMY